MSTSAPPKVSGPAPVPVPVRNHPPTPDEVLDALFTLTEWAVGPNRDGNPYRHPPVKAALRVLSLAFGGSGDWAEGLEVARRARNLPPKD